MKKPRVVFMTGLIALWLPTLAAGAAPDWVTRSNAYSSQLLGVMAKFIPEQAGSLGVDGLDDAILDLGPDLYERQQQALRQVTDELSRRLGTEAPGPVRQDLQILVKAAEDQQHSNKLQHELLLDYYNVNRIVFQGIRALIDPQVSKDRYPAAVVRLAKYAGLERGIPPLTELAMERSRERFGVKGLLGPFRGEVEQDLDDAQTYVDGVRDLLQQSGVKGWQQPYDALAQQLQKYNEWVRTEILPRARDDFRLPLALYADALRNYGVDADPEQLIRMAAQGYMDIRNEMDALAPLVAREKGYDTSDYREVIRRLRQQQIPGDRLVDYYAARVADMDRIIGEHRLLTLPDRKTGIRMGSAAETAASPAPHLDVPRLIGNSGEYPEFVIPQLEKNPDGSWKGNDDTYEAGSWTLTAHEARPGHELQFSAMLETGVSTARAIFAFNSVNVEGWGLYAEALARPFEPLDGQLIALQYRLVRAARMFLDPMLNLGRITPAVARRILVEDVALGEDWADTEIERYTYRAPGQATAYYYGYSELQALRTETEIALADRFDQQSYHDFILAQGLLPPDLLRRAIMEEYVPSRLAAGASR